MEQLIFQCNRVCIQTRAFFKWPIRIGIRIYTSSNFRPNQTYVRPIQWCGIKYSPPAICPLRLINQNTIPEAASVKVHPTNCGRIASIQCASNTPLTYWLIKQICFHFEQAFIARFISLKQRYSHSVNADDGQFYSVNNCSCRFIYTVKHQVRNKLIELKIGASGK